MDVHEYQAKELLADHGVSIPRGGVVYSPEQATYRAKELGGSAWVVKAQIHSGGRGEAGGVRLCQSDTDVRTAASELLGTRLVTKQSDGRGYLVNRIYVEEVAPIERELYFALLIDRAVERIILVASREGGMEIEELAEQQPDAVIRLQVEPAVGLLEFQARELAFNLGIEPELLPKATALFLAAYRTFRALDAELLEINPLAITVDGNIVALDAKLTFDDNALFRHPEIAELRDRSQEDQRESHATDRGLSYVGLDGDIGCIINGAGLAMATLDMIKLAGGSPANFLDIGGGASPERVRKAFRAVLLDDAVKVILVNIFAGINRCDWVAEGVIDAFRKLEIRCPVVVRLAGTHVEEGNRILAESGLPIVTALNLADAAQLSVGLASGDKAKTLTSEATV